MKRRYLVGGLVGLAWVGGQSGAAHAAPELRVEVSQRGDFLLIGNTLGYECGVDGPRPVPTVGTVGDCGTTALVDSAPDVFWRSDSPMVGQAEAHIGITADQARSTAWLAVPAGATVTHAYLYWAAHTAPNAPADTTVTLDRPLAGGLVFEEQVNATAPSGGSFIAAEPVEEGDPPRAPSYYQSFADITAIVQEHGTGAYRVSGVHSKELANADDDNSFAGWWMVVFYELATEPPRHLALFHGLDPVNSAADQEATLSGFVVPAAGFDAKIGMVAFEGDRAWTGDQFFFGAAPALSNAQNPVDNFFNGTRSNAAGPVTVAGDLPQLSGRTGIMSGMDIDILDITSKLRAGQTSAPIRASSTGDLYFLAGFVTSISTFKPDFTSSTKRAVDVNGGALLPGDVIEYTILVRNSGNDASIDTVLTDELPEGVTYVPGSMAIGAGAGAVRQTDAAGDDLGEFSAGTGTLTVRLGQGANGTDGGSIAAGASETVTFRVTVNAGATGLIENQAVVNAAGQQGAPPEETPTDGDDEAGGAQPTDVVIDLCQTNAECASPTPHCKTEATPNVCVACLTDAHCGPLQPTCEPTGNTCVCVPAAAEICTDTIDNDCDGVISNGCDADEDGAEDPDEIAAGTDPNDADSDDDGALDGAEPSFDQDTDGDGLINALDPDSDNDGLHDGTELGLDCENEATNAAAGHCRPDGDEGATKTNPLDADTDDGGVPDGWEDADLDGVVDEGETDPNVAEDDATPPTDTDGDGLSDELEETLGSDPEDADTDDDGVIDGQEVNPADDTDGDGLLNVIDVDSDDDGLFDGTELGLDCENEATDAEAGHCRADVDPTTRTSPVDPDSDNGGVNDGQEDVNRDGAVDEGELDPNDPTDDVVTDTDRDGLNDAAETAIGTDPNDADSDDDGVLDGDEPNYSDDHDGDGTINALDPDSDGDGLFDGTELGRDCENEATSAEAESCIADADPETKTHPLDRDTDRGGIPDGTEDTNHNGAVDEGETDPRDPADDADDRDGDGLADPIEEMIGTDPDDADSDDDGALDGQEQSPGEDSDGDGDINALDPDSDNDGLFDGTELGFDCENEATSAEAASCIADADPETTTDPLDEDSDDGGVSDGDEDTNHNGAIDAGERDPNDAGDDVVAECREDIDCGGATSGRICDTEAGTCVDGCRGAEGNGCPSGQVCSSTDDSPGTCGPADTDDPSGIYAEGNGLCAARPTPAGSGRGMAALLPMLAAIAGLVLRRFRRTNG